MCTCFDIAPITPFQQSLLHLHFKLLIISYIILQYLNIISKQIVTLVKSSIIALSLLIAFSQVTHNSCLVAPQSHVLTMSTISRKKLHHSLLWYTSQPTNKPQNYLNLYTPAGLLLFPFNCCTFNPIRTQCCTLLICLFTLQQSPSLKKRFYSVAN